jgi:hypothetical protein
MNFELYISKNLLREELTMKKTSTFILAIFIVLMTAAFGFAESKMVVQGYQFPFFQLGMLIVGGLVILSLKHKYNKLYLFESLGVFALYMFMVSLFTDPVIDMIKVVVT